MTDGECWTPAVAVYGRAFRGKVTSPWPPESNRTGNRSSVCPHSHRTQNAAFKCADRAACRGGWPGHTEPGEERA